MRHNVNRVNACSVWCIVIQVRRVAVRCSGDIRVDWRRIQSEPDLADNKGDTFQIAQATNAHESLDHALTSAVVVAASSCSRKPSERFMRRSLQARSKASTSERYRIADLKEKLNDLVIDKTNEASVFNGYRPGHEAMPG